jgi:RNA polymerase sigma factor (sigma-70 family)
MSDRIDLNQLKTHKMDKNKYEFKKILEDFLPELKKLVHHKLRQWEVKGEIPKDRYSADEIVDDVYVKIFDEFHDSFTDERTLKVKMLAVARGQLNAIKEKHSQRVISYEKLVAEEMKELEENYTVDSEGELILMEDLDDISYDTHDREDIILLENENFDELTGSFDLPETGELSDEEKRKIGKIYSDLPELTRSVVDHYVFVKLSTVQIAEIHNISEDDVNWMLNRIKERFEKLKK